MHRLSQLSAGITLASLIILNLWERIPSSPILRYIMRRFCINQQADHLAFEARSIRLNGKCTSIRLEAIFWNIIERLAKDEGLSVPRFCSVLHNEISLHSDKVGNFSSHLRCFCVLTLAMGPPNSISVWIKDQ